MTLVKEIVECVSRMRSYIGKRLNSFEVAEYNGCPSSAKSLMLSFFFFPFFLFFFPFFISNYFFRLFFLREIFSRSLFVSVSIFPTTQRHTHTHAPLSLSLLSNLSLSPSLARSLARFHTLTHTNLNMYKQIGISVSN